jgi:hypothetical protein
MEGRKKSSRSGRTTNAPSAASSLGIPTRGPTSAEQEQLLRATRAPASAPLRFLGILAGLGGIMLAVTYFLGTPYDPSTFSVEAPLVGLVALVFAGAASVPGRLPRRALSRGETLDITAVPGSPTPAAGGRSAVALGPLIALVPPAEAERWTPGQRHRVVIAMTGVPMPTRSAEPTESGLLLSVDGEARARPVTVYVARAPLGDAAAPTVWVPAVPAAAPPAAAVR